MEWYKEYLIKKAAAPGGYFPPAQGYYLPGDASVAAGRQAMKDRPKPSEQPRVGLGAEMSGWAADLGGPAGILAAPQLMLETKMRNPALAAERRENWERKTPLQKTTSGLSALAGTVIPYKAVSWIPQMIAGDVAPDYVMSPSEAWETLGAHDLTGSRKAVQDMIDKENARKNTAGSGQAKMQQDAAKQQAETTAKPPMQQPAIPHSPAPERDAVGMNPSAPKPFAPGSTTQPAASTQQQR